MRIRLDKVGNARKEGKFGRLDIEYTRDGGKSSKRTLVAIGGTKDVMNQFREDGAVGADWEIELETVEKNGETYYNWVKATKVEGGTAPAKAAYQAKSTYETPEERARKQVYIARQNALTNAVNYYVAKDAKVTPTDIISLAEEFASFTLGEIDVTMPDAPPSAEAPKAASKKKAGDDEDFDDDIPF